MCYHTKFCRCRSNRLGYIGGPKKFFDARALPLGMWTWLVSSKYTFPHLCYHAKFSHSRSDHTSIIVEICQKMLIPRASPVKVIGTNTGRSATYDYLLVFRSNYSPILYCFRDKWWKNFPFSLFLMPHLRGFPLGFYNGGGARRNWNDAPTNMSKSVICPIFLHSTSSGQSRQTDGENW